MEKTLTRPPIDEGLKPYAMKVARTVSRGGGISNEALLLGTSPMRKYSSEEYWSIAVRRLILYTPALIRFQGQIASTSVNQHTYPRI
jgi:hypothetical protein